MKPIPLVALIAFASPATAQTYQGEFAAARALEKSDPQASADGMILSFEHALAAGDHEYTSVAGLNACGTIYRQGKTVEAGKLARRVITALALLHDDYPDSAALRRVQFFGYMERGLVAEGKIGAAWQANRAAAETLRGKIVAADADGQPITMVEIREMNPELRSYGFRVIECEANLLNLSGRSSEALALLDEAAEFFGNDWQQRFDSFEQFHAFKLLASRAELLDFLGEKEKAIEAEQGLVAAVNPTANIRQSHLTLRMNLLRNRSQWDGPSEEILGEAREVASEMKRQKIDNNVDRLLAKMEFDLKESREPLDAIRRNLLKNQGLGDAFEAVYAERDSLLARAELGDANLDSEFQTVLKTLRSHGNKRGEPSLYRSYGDYLLRQKRPAEAITMLAESLRMTRSFGWVLHEPGLLGALIGARITAGDLSGARATLAELDAWIAAHGDAPVGRLAMAATARAETIAKLGDEAGARSAFQLAREIARNLPEYQRRALTAEAEEQVIAQGRQPAAIAAATTAPLLSVQPLEVVGVAVPGEAARTRFSVFNPTAQSLQGRFVLTGPAAVVAAGGNGATFTAGGAAVTAGLPKTLSAGGEARVEISVAAAKGVNAGAIQVAWENVGQASGPAASWQIAWSPDASRSVVLDASHLEANPFRSVSLFHELAVPLNEAIGIPFRLRSAVPLRFEYFDADSHQLLAIDANGNGDFTEAGDLHIRGPQGVTGAIFPVASGNKSVTAEVRIFAIDGLPLLTTGSTLILEAEVHRNGSWTKEAEDTLK